METDTNQEPEKVIVVDDVNKDGDHITSLMLTLLSLFSEELNIGEQGK